MRYGTLGKLRGGAKEEIFNMLHFGGAVDGIFGA